MRQVTDLAELRGWAWLHVRPGRTADSWRTPVSGPLGKGWPDLVLVREHDRRLIFAELKRDSMHLTPEQQAVMATLGSLAAEPQLHSLAVPLVNVFTWRPSDWDEIEAVLR